MGWPKVLREHSVIAGPRIREGKMMVKMMLFTALVVFTTVGTVQDAMAEAWYGEYERMCAPFIHNAKLYQQCMDQCYPPYGGFTQ